ncbi:MAG: GNAT family N-acetyltransferase [Pseudomonadota bacterium]
MVDQQPFKCEYSALTIPNDPEYASVAGAYAATVSRKVGFSEADWAMIERGVAKAVSVIMAYSFDPDQREKMTISCERVPEGLKIVVEDMGLPFDPACGPVGPEEADAVPCPGSDMVEVRRYMDEVLFRNLGREGKRTILVKHLKNRTIEDYYDSCDLSPYPERTSASQPVHADTVDVTVRRMLPEEAVEVSKCIYKTYGYSYSNEHVYYPDRVRELNRSGRMHTAVAVTKDGRIAGQCALVFESGSSEGPQSAGGVSKTRVGMAELAQAAVKPEFRGQGVLRGLTRYVIEQARLENLVGVFARAVTLHTFSQKAIHDFGLRDCAVIIGYFPKTHSFKGIQEQLRTRMTAAVSFLHLDGLEGALDRTPGSQSRETVYAPRHHGEMTAKIYRNLGRYPRFCEQAPLGTTTDEHNSALPDTTEGSASMSVLVLASLSYARIVVERYGPTIVRDVKRALRDLCLERVDVIVLFLNLFDPGTHRMCEEFENLGFFFSGVLPSGTAGGDALMLQYLNNFETDYDEAKLYSDFGRELLGYARERDPNRR